MKLFLKLILLPLIFISIDLISRFPLFYLYNQWQLLFYFISVVVSISFFIILVLLLSKLKKTKILFNSSIFFLSIFLLIAFLGSYVFYSFNGFFPNFYSLLYFRTEPESTFLLLKDSVKTKDIVYFCLIEIPVFIYLRYLCFQNYSMILNRNIFLAFSRLLVVYFFLFVYHNKFDQCLIVDVNFAINLQRHLVDNTDHMTFSGKGHSVRNPILLTKMKKKSQFNVLVIVFESMRKDRLQAYNYSRETTPNLEKFRLEHENEFHVFKRPYTVSTTTMLAVPAILTGIGSHQAKELVYSQPLLWEYAKMLNYETFFMSSHSMQWYRFYNYYQKNKPNHFWTKETSGKPFFNDLGIDDKFTVDHLNEQIKLHKKKYFFGVIQLNSTHYPYNIPSKYKKWKDNFSDSYDNAVLYQDAVLKELWETLKRENKLENTVIFFVSDHAESLKDHSNIGHVDSYYSETVSIPLMVYLPEKIAKNYKLKNFLGNKNKITSNIDIAPTIIDLLKIDNNQEIKPLLYNFDGFSLFRKIPKNREVITMNNNDIARFKIGVSLIKGDLHYLWRINVVPNREELYNIKSDPKETKNLISNYSKSKLEFLKRNMRKHLICRKFLRKYEVF